MRQYKPIVIRIKYCIANDILTTSVEGIVKDGKGKEFDVGWILDLE